MLHKDPSSKKKKTTAQPPRVNGTFPTLTPLARLVRPIVKDLLPQKMVYFRQLFVAWPDLVAGTEAANSIIEKLTFARGQQTDGQLYVWAQTSAQAMEINFNQALLIQKINGFFGGKVVGALRVTAFPTTAKPAPTIPQTVNPLPRNKSQSLDKSLAQISNPELKTTLAKLGSLLGDDA